MNDKTETVDQVYVSKQNSKPLTIMTYGDNCYTSTGYGQIWENLLMRWPQLKPNWKFYHVGWQNHDREHLTREGYVSLPIAGQEYGFDTVLTYLMKYKPDILLTMADVGITAGFIDAVGEARKKGWNGRWAAISLFDTESWEHMLWGKILEIPDINIAGAKNGEILMTKHNVPNVKYIPLGVDSKRYLPLANKEELRKKFGFENRFVIGFVGKNQRRKFQSYLLKAFAQFSKGKNDVTLLLHTDVEAPSGWSIPCLIAKYEVEIDPEIEKPKPKVIITSPGLNVLSRQRISTEAMNEIYNFMNMFCYVGGEGFGLPGIEAQSAGVPLAMLDYSAAVEIVCEKDLLIPTMKDSYGRDVAEIGQNGIENSMPDDIATSKIFEKLYQEWKEGKLEERNKRARQFAIKYDWDLIANKWIKFFEDEA
jgi:glycosyltransferase involved in cell wall biosynthesis